MTGVQTCALPISASEDPAMLYSTDIAFMTVLKEATLTMYSFGAPRCGDDDFKRVSKRIEVSPKIIIQSIIKKKKKIFGYIKLHVHFASSTGNCI